MRMSAIRKSVKVLARHLQDEAYKHGLIDAQDGLSDKRYRDAADRANTARNELLAAVAELTEASQKMLDAGVSDLGKLDIARAALALALARCTGGSP